MGNQVTQAAERSGQSFQNFSAKAALLGAAATAVTGVLSDFSRAAAEDQVSQQRVQQSIENTGQAYDKLAPKVDQAIAQGQKKAFTDDQVRDAIVRLNLVTNDAAASLSQLGLVEDFARAKNIDLGTAADIVGKVYGGNTSILTRYGIILDKNATSAQALAEIQKRTAGQANTYASTELGQLEQRKIQWDELTESIGRHAGALQSVLLLLPGLSAGYTALGGALAGMGGISGIAGLLPLLGGAAVVGGGASLAYGYSQDSIGTTGTNKFWNDFFMTGSKVINALTPGNAFDVNKYQDQIKSNKAGDLINQTLLGPGEDQSVVWNRIHDLTGTITGEMSTKDLINYVVAQANKQNETVNQYLSKLAASNKGYVQDPVTGTYMPIGDFINYSAQRNGINSYGAIGQARDASNAGAMSPNGPPPWFAYWMMHGSSTAISMFGHGDDARANLTAYHAGGSGAVANDLYAAAATPGAHNEAVRQAARAAATSAAIATVQATADAIKKYAPGLGITLPQAGVGGYVDNHAGMAARAGTANSAAASGFQVAVGNTNAIGSQVKAVNDWATELINVKGTYGQIDDLLAKGVINQNEYNAAQAAGTSIFASNAAIQQDILKIQTDQAPVIADLTAAQQKYMDHIANDLTPAQQMLALAYMDTGEQAKANTALTLAAAAANGELGAVGEKTATAMISAAAEADPYLQAMLVDMGLITVGADGTITVNFDDVKNAHDSTGDLIGAVDNLISLIAQTMLINIDLNDNGALGQIYAIEAALNAAAGTYVANFYLNQVGGNAPGGPQFPPGMNGLTAMANGGTAYDPLMPRFRDGGTYALVGEVGPEIVKLSRGDQVMPTGASRTQMNRANRGGGGNNNFYGPVTLVPAGQDAHRAISQAALGEARY